MLSMLAKEPQVRPTAEAVYGALLPLASTPRGSSPEGMNRDPTRPFRWPLLAASRRREQANGRGLTDAEAELLMANVRALLDNDRPSDPVPRLSR
ncbi:MAG: hypothetical protein ACRDRJ_03360 [Streptosporangiaceae bacterium]